MGGPGVRVASVPEFLAKQLLKQFGFPWHVAPGEAEAECALFQQEGIVDAVLSEDVDTLMFGSGVTLRNWTSENTTKSPTHVNVYRQAETKDKSGLDGEGMILVALMSGGDYLPEGIPGCGPKVACDAARAGFGKDLCALGKKDTAGMKLWMERLQHQIRTNEAKYFSRRNTAFTIPEDFPNLEVLGYYTHPCVSTPEKLQKLKESLRWDQSIDFAALRSFTGDAFDWRCLGGAKKFIKNLAPAMLVRELRLCAEREPEVSQEAQEEREKSHVRAVHGKRNHSTTDGELEYRISFTPATLVPIDLSIEEEDDQFLPAGGEDSDAESEFATLPSSIAGGAGGDGTESEAPSSPSKKKRNFRPFDPAQPEKLWILRTFLQIGCPLLVEEYEASFRDPKAFLKARRKAKAAAGKVADGNIHAAAKPKKAAGGGRKKKDVSSDMPDNALMAYTKTTKSASAVEREPLKETSSQGNSQAKAVESDFGDDDLKALSGFKLPFTQIPRGLLEKYVPEPQRRTASVQPEIETIDLQETPRPFARFARPAITKQPVQSQAEKVKPGTKPAPKPKAKAKTTQVEIDVQKTPTRRKRRSPDLSSPALSQRTITSYYSPSPRKPKPFVAAEADFVNLISSSPVKAPAWELEPERALTPTPPNLRHHSTRSREQVLPLGSRNLLHDDEIPDFSPGKLPNTVTKRRKKGAFKRYRTAPAVGADDVGLLLSTPTLRAATPDVEEEVTVVEAMDLASPSPARTFGAADELGGGGFLVESDDELPSPSFLIDRPSRACKQPSRKAVLMEDLGLDGTAEEPLSSYPSPPAEDGEDADLPPASTLFLKSARAPRPSQPMGEPLAPEPPTTAMTPKRSKLAPKPAPAALKATAPKPSTSKPSAAAASAIRCSPHQHQQRKKAIQLRQSLEGAWKEVDLTDDGSGWKQSNGRAALGGKNGGWRVSGVEVLDLTGA